MCKLLFSRIGPLLAILVAQTITLFGQSTFTYQGRLETNGIPLSGHYTFSFQLFTNAVGGFAASPVLTTNLQVANGLFSTGLEFGTTAFTGQPLWLQISVAPSNTPPVALTPLSPRQRISAAPYAITASNLSGTISASQLTGTILDSRLSANVSRLGSSIESSELTDGTIVNGDIHPAAGIADTKLATLSTAGKVANSATTATSANTANAIVSRDSSGAFSAGTITATFAGNGASLSNLNASRLSSGTVPDSLLSTGIGRRSGGNAWTGIQTITGGSLGIGDVPTNPLTVSSNGTTTGGVLGFPEVVARFRNPQAGMHTALSLDALPSQDSVVYFSGAGMAVWGLRYDASDARKFQLRYHGPNAGPVLTATTNGSVGIGTDNPAAKLHVAGPVQVRPSPAVTNAGVSVLDVRNDGAARLASFGTSSESKLWVDKDGNLTSGSGYVNAAGGLLTSGNLFVGGNATINNMPFVKSVQFDNPTSPIAFTNGENKDLATLNVEVPAPGFLVVSAYMTSSRLALPSFDLPTFELKLDEMPATGGPGRKITAVTFRAAIADVYNQIPLSLQWVIPFSKPGSINLKTSGYADGGPFGIAQHNLIVTYFPLSPSQ